jgi:hypothetical protein
MRAEEAKAMMVEARKLQAEKIHAEVIENVEKCVLPQIAKSAKSGRSATIIKVPNYKSLYADRLVELGYNVTYEKKNDLFVRWA